MLLYRIARTARVRDLSGTGAKLYGGRWNRKGTAVVYASETRALATVEFLVHVPMALTPAHYSLASIEVPDGERVEEVRAADLPRNWRTFPAPDRLGVLGTRWALACSSLLLRVPSVVVEHEYNVLINPAHRAMDKVRILSTEPYRFDPQLIRPKGAGGRA